MRILSVEMRLKREVLALSLLLILSPDPVNTCSAIVAFTQGKTMPIEHSNIVAVFSVPLKALIPE